MLDDLRMAVAQHQSGATGDQTSPTTRMGNTLSEMGGVATRYGDSVKAVFAPLSPPGGPPFDKMPPAQQAAAVIRRAQQAVGAVAGLLSVAQDMVDVGFANLTAPIAAAFPDFPAATMMSLYVGIPHSHAHPPSLIPPAPPIPLPSLGPIVLGTSVRVVIGGKPAARLGALGFAPTCGGLAPIFKVFLGSSNVFIGGKRAARILDVCRVCTKAATGGAAAGAAGALAAVGSVASAALKVVEVAGKAAGYLGIAADLAEAAAAPEPAMAAAKALSAAMNVAQMAADAAAQAVEAAMGTDPAAGTQPVGIGAVVVPGSATVLIGGFPMIHIPNPAEAILNALKRFKPPAEGGEEDNTDPEVCPI
ncbi:MAG: PAAR domain-containing protein [Thermoguttaceae bacterium]